MAATPIVATNRFIHTELSKVIYLPACADKTAPTRSEINAGTDLSSEVADMSGWQVQSNQVDAPDYGHRFTAQIAGRITAPSSSLTFYADDNGADVRSLLPRDSVGFILFADGGDTAGNKADVFPIKVSSLGKERSVGEEPARLVVDFTITSVPGENVSIPA